MAPGAHDCPVALAAPGLWMNPTVLLPPSLTRAALAFQGSPSLQLWYSDVLLPSSAEVTSLGPRAATMTFPSPLGPASNPWRRGEVVPSPSCCRQPCHQVPVVGHPSPDLSWEKNRCPAPSKPLIPLQPAPSTPGRPPPPHYLWGHGVLGGFRAVVPQGLNTRFPVAPGCIPAGEGGGAAAVPGSPGAEEPLPLREAPRSPGPGEPPAPLACLGGAPGGVRLPGGAGDVLLPCHLVRLSPS